MSSLDVIQTIRRRKNSKNAEIQAVRHQSPIQDSMPLNRGSKERRETFAATRTSLDGESSGLLTEKPLSALNIWPCPSGNGLGHPPLQDQMKREMLASAAYSRNVAAPP
jgi:hypothetical protein